MNTKRRLSVLPTLALPLLAWPAMAQTTGVSHPEDAAQDTTPATVSADHYIPPSRTAAATPQTVSGTDVSYPATGPAVSYAATGPVPSSAATEPPQPAPGLIVREPASTLPATPGTYAPGQLATAAPTPPPSVEDDSGIVTEVPAAPFQLPIGTVLRTRLDVPLRTDTAVVGSPFAAELLADAAHNGQVLLPAGAVLHGRVAAVHGGRRITGGAAIRLQPQTVTLPDGTSYPLRATVTAIDSEDNLKVNDEGVINARSSAKATAGVIGGTTAVAAVTGAVVGGGVGAAVGAGIGAGVGTIVWLRQDNQATLPVGTTLFFSLDEPLQLSPR